MKHPKLNNPNLTNEEKTKLLKATMSSEDKDSINEMLKNGMSLEEAMKQIASNKAHQEKPNDIEENEFERRIRKLCNGKILPDEEMLELIRQNLIESDQKKLSVMVENGCSIRDIIKYFLR